MDTIQLSSQGEQKSWFNLNLSLKTYRDLAAVLEDVWKCIYEFIIMIKKWLDLFTARKVLKQVMISEINN